MALYRIYSHRRRPTWGRWVADQGPRAQVLTAIWCTALIVLCTGCVGVRTEGEKAARQNLRALEESYRPGGQRPVLPLLTADSPLSDFLLFAMLNQPQVEAAYSPFLTFSRRISARAGLKAPQAQHLPMMFAAPLGVSLRSFT